MFASKDALFAKSSGGYRISRSLRFRQSAKAQLSRTFGAPSSSLIWTISFWMKRGKLNSANYQDLMSSSTDASAYYIDHLIENDYLEFQYGKAGTSATNLTTAPVLRDISGWYHVVFAVDLTQTTASNRVRIYLNGVQLTVSGTQPTQNDTTYKFNQNSIVHYIASEGSAGSTTANFDGYLAEFIYLDGYPTVSGTTYNATTWAALNVSTLFTANDVNGVLQPKQYTGTYGNNGFYLPFSDNTSATTLCYDKSVVNTNNWTPANISVATGTTYDSMIDSPTNYSDGGTGRGNYAVLNPVSNIGNGTISNGNLSYTSGAAAWKSASGTIFAPSGKWYFEATLTNSSNSAMYGVINTSFPASAYGSYPGASAYGWALQSSTGGTGKWNNNSSTSVDAVSQAANDVYMVAFDVDAGKVWFGKNGTWYGSGNPATGANAAYTNLTGQIAPIVSTSAASDVVALNCGQQPFTYTPPSGFSALNTQNLPTPTIAAGNKYFDATTYPGDGAASGRNISLNFSPDLMWIKSRSLTTGYHFLFDGVRGATKVLGSSQTAAEYTNGDLGLGTNQFTIGDNGGLDEYNPNKNTATYVAWGWNAGGAPTTDNVAGAGNVPTAGSVKINGANSSASLAGSIAATRISANTSAGFSVVTFTGNGTNGSSVGHGLGVAPSMIILKKRSAALDWYVGATAIGWDKSLSLNLTAAQTTGGQWFGNGTGVVPTSTVFYLGGAGNFVNDSGSTYVVYCFAPVAGYSAFGSYTGNGSTDGAFIYTGFRPRYVLIKRTDAVNNWVIFDTSRIGYNVANYFLLADSSSAELTDIPVDILSNGFKNRGTGGTANASGGTYIYAAFAENPFRIARAR